MLESKSMDVISDRTDVLKILPDAAAELCTALFRNSPAGIYITRDGKFIYTNIEFRRITGYSQHELLGKDYLKLINPRYRQMPKQHMAPLFDEEVSDTSHEFKITTRDGKKKWISEKITYFKYGGNWLTLGHWLDISEHHAIEKAWREAERRFQLAFEDITTGLAIISLDNIFLKVNRSFCDMVGYDENELLESHFDEILPSTDRASRGDIMNLFLSLEKPEEPLQLRMLCKDGRISWSAVSISLIGDSEAGPSYFMVNFHDITEQKRREDGLKEEEWLYRSLIELSTEPLAVIDLDFHFTHVSRGFISRIGYESEHDLLGKNIDSIARTEADEKLGTLLMDMLKQDNSASIVCNLLMKNGELLPVNLYISRINRETGAPFCFALALRSAETARPTQSEEATTPDIELKKETFPHPLVTALENTTTAFMIVNQNTIIEACNPAFENMSGYSREEIQGKKSWIEFVAKEDQSRLKRYYLLRRIDPGSAPDTFDFKFCGRNDGLRDMLASISPLDDTTRFIVTLIDLSGYKDIAPEKQTIASLESYRDALEASPGATVLTDLDGNITFISRSAFERFGESKSDFMLGKNLRLFIRPGMLQDIDLAIQELKEKGVLPGKEIDFIRRDGQIITCEISGSVVNRYDDSPFLAFSLYDISDQKQVVESMENSLAQLDKTLLGTLTAITKIVELRDPYISGHHEGVAALSVAIAREMGLPDYTVKGIEVSARIHDIGKVYIPVEILNKPTRLTDIERQIIQSHAQGSYDILKTIDFAWPVAEAAYQHHERLNGSGYPRGLKGNEIIIEARILMVADVVEAMTSYRPYRPESGIESALQEITTGSGSLYDPMIVDCCVRLFKAGHFSFGR